MGVDFRCDDCGFCCRYSYWNDIRIEIIHATFLYILDKFEKDEELYKDITDEDDENFIGEGSTYYCYKKQILEIKKAIYPANRVITDVFSVIVDDKVPKFLSICKSDYSKFNALNYFDIGGLFAISNQSDCEGFYTSGNSLDICQLLDKIKNFVNNKNSIYDCIYVNKDRLYDVFEESYKKNKKIRIC